MKTLAIPASWPLRRTSLVFGVMLALSLTSGLNAAPPPPPAPLSLLTSYLGSDYGVYALNGNGGTRTNGAWSVGGGGVFALDSLSTLQVDAGYFRLTQGGGLPGSNAWTADAHYSYTLNDLPVGAFLGEFSNGPTTWGGGLETTLPLGKIDWLPGGVSPSSDPLINFQGFYGRTHSTRLNHWGGCCEMRLYPLDVLRVSLNLEYQHTSSNSIPGFSFSDNIYSVGLGCGYQFPCGWIAYGDYAHTHFNRSGLGVDGFTFGARYCFGKKPKIRDTEVPYASFSQLLGVSAKF